MRGSDSDPCPRLGVAGQTPGWEVLGTMVHQQPLHLVFRTSSPSVLFTLLFRLIIVFTGREALSADKVRCKASVTLLFAQSVAPPSGDLLSVVCFEC